MTYLDVGDDAASFGGGVAATVVIARNVVAIVYVDASGSKIARSKKKKIVEHIYISLEMFWLKYPYK